MKAPTPRIATAYDEVLKTDNGRLVMADILITLCGHGIPTDDPKMRERQQLANEILLRSVLFNANQGSFPYDYVSMLTKHKLQTGDDPKTATKPSRIERTGLMGRLFGRKKN